MGEGKGGKRRFAVAEIELEFCSTSDPRYVQIRIDHYIKSLDNANVILNSDGTGTLVGQSVLLDAREREAKGAKVFGERGQQATFLVWYKGELAGVISGGGAVKCTRTRNEFFGVPMKLPKTGEPTWINGIVDNSVYCLINREKGLFGKVLSAWEKIIPFVWQDLYGIPVYGFETFIEPDEAVGRGRGVGYLDTGWKFVGVTAGKAVSHPKGTGMSQVVAGKSTRVYGDTIPKNVFCKWRKGFSTPIWCLYESSWKATTPEEKRIAREKTASRKRLMGARCFVVDKVRVSIGGVVRDAREEFKAWRTANPEPAAMSVARSTKAAMAT